MARKSKDLRVVTEEDLKLALQMDDMEETDEDKADNDDEAVSEESELTVTEASEDTEAANEITTKLTDKIDDLSDAVENTNRELEELQSIESRLANEDVVVQEKNWMDERAREQREAEDTYREELFEKQKLLEEKRKELSEKFTQNKQMKTYNQMHDDEQTELVYALHGVSSDMIEGMQEYKNALFQGAAIILLLTGAVICAATAYMYGVKSEIFLVSIALFAANTTLLPRESFGKIQGGLYNGICKLLCILPTPAMGALLILNSVEPSIYTMCIEWAGIVVAGLCLFGALGYMFRNPYRSMRHAVRAAKSDVKDLKKTASKTVKKNKKTREKLESKLLKRKEKQEGKLERLKSREAEKIEKLKNKEAERVAKLKAKEEEKTKKLAAKLEIENEKKARAEELAETRRVNREKYKELYGQKITNFKLRFASLKKNANTTENALTDKAAETETEVVEEQKIS